jgi:hypothetical protein
VNCDDPQNISLEETTKFWAIDKSDIPQAPKGWERFTKVRSDGTFP